MRLKERLEQLKNFTSYKELLIGKKKRSNDPRFYAMKKLILKKKIQSGRLKRKDHNSHILKFLDVKIQTIMKEIRND